MSQHHFNGFRLVSRLISLFIVTLVAVVDPEVEIPSFSGVKSADLAISGDVLLTAADSRYIQAIATSSNPQDKLAVRFVQKPTVKPVFASKVISRRTVAAVVAAVPVSNATQSAYDELFTKYSGMFGVEERKLKVIANCESHYNPASQSKNGLYGGMYQYSASTWSATRAAMGADTNPELRFDAEQAIMTSAWKIAHGGIGAWPVCGKK